MQVTTERKDSKQDPNANSNQPLSPTTLSEGVKAKQNETNRAGAATTNMTDFMNSKVSEHKSDLLSPKKAKKSKSISLESSS